MRQQLRIIGGQWRRRHIMFPVIVGLRPTPDRVRETLFNWLAPIIDGMHCLDLFAGSGILGLEALSRGAREVVLVDQSAKAIAQLRQTCQLLNTTAVAFYQATIPTNLPLTPFDVIFLDPPFGKDLITISINWLRQQKLLKSTTIIYFEQESAAGLPAGVYKLGRTQQITYGLLRLDNASAS